jgi:hypothetical protein
MPIVGFRKLVMDPTNFEISGKRTHVRGDEHPLWKSIVVQILIKHGQVLDFGQAVVV